MQPIAITQGDPAGIGPEIVAKAFRDAPDALRHCFVVGDVATVRCAAGVITRPGVPVCPWRRSRHRAKRRTLRPAASTCCNCRYPGSPSLRVRSAPPPAVLRRTAWSGPRAPRCVEVAALVTAPVHKEALSAAGVGFPGHTELLQAEAAAHQDVSLAQMPGAHDAGQ